MNIVIEETFLDYPSPDDTAVIVFLPGCSHKCLGCQNPDLQQLHEEYSEKESKDIIERINNMCLRCDTNKLVLSGGDPLNPCNRKLSKLICEELGKEKDICIYTGYEIDEVKEMNINGFKIIKCGKFDCNNVRKSEKTDDELILATPNQNFYDSNYNQLSENGILKFN